MDARARYDDLADFLAFRHDFVELSQMMGMPCVKARGKMVAGFPGGYGAMVFKLTDPDVHARALALEGAVLFDPGGERPAVQAMGRGAAGPRGALGGLRRSRARPQAR